MNKLTRLEANRLILKLLEAEIEKYPEQRFGQILRNMRIVEDVGIEDTMAMYLWKDEFYTESEETLANIQLYSLKETL